MITLNSLRDPSHIRRTAASLSTRHAATPGPLTGSPAAAARSRKRPAGPLPRTLRIPRNGTRQNYVVKYVICRMESGRSLPYC